MAGFYCSTPPLLYVFLVFSIPVALSGVGQGPSASTVHRFPRPAAHLVYEQPQRSRQDDVVKMTWPEVGATIEDSSLYCILLEDHHPQTQSGSDPPTAAQVVEEAKVFLAADAPTTAATTVLPASSTTVTPHKARTKAEAMNNVLRISIHCRQQPRSKCSGACLWHDGDCDISERSTLLHMGEPGAAADSEEMKCSRKSEKECSGDANCHWQIMTNHGEWCALRPGLREESTINCDGQSLAGDGQSLAECKAASTVATAIAAKDAECRSNQEQCGSLNDCSWDDDSGECGVSEVFATAALGLASPSIVQNIKATRNWTGVSINALSALCKKLGQQECVRNCEWDKDHNSCDVSPPAAMAIMGTQILSRDGGAASLPAAAPTQTTTAAATTTEAATAKATTTETIYTTTSALYYRVSSGTCASAGYEVISDVSSCIAAATSLGLSGSSKPTPGLPAGCIQAASDDGGSDKWLNFNSGGWGFCGYEISGARYDCICMKATTTFLRTTTPEATAHPPYVRPYASTAITTSAANHLTFSATVPVTTSPKGLLARPQRSLEEVVESVSFGESPSKRIVSAVAAISKDIAACPTQREHVAQKVLPRPCYTRNLDGQGQTVFAFSFWFYPFVDIKPRQSYVAYCVTGPDGSSANTTFTVEHRTDIKRPKGSMLRKQLASNDSGNHSNTRSSNSTADDDAKAAAAAYQAMQQPVKPFSLMALAGIIVVVMAWSKDMIPCLPDSLRRQTQARTWVAPSDHELLDHGADPDRRRSSFADEQNMRWSQLQGGPE